MEQRHFADCLQNGAGCILGIPALVPEEQIRKLGYGCLPAALNQLPSQHEKFLLLVLCEREQVGEDYLGIPCFVPSDFLKGFRTGRLKQREDGFRKRSPRFIIHAFNPGIHGLVNDFSGFGELSPFKTVPAYTPGERVMLLNAGSAASNHLLFGVTFKKQTDDRRIGYDADKLRQNASIRVGLHDFGTKSRTVIEVDRENPILWIGCILASVTVLSNVFIATKRKKNNG